MTPERRQEIAERLAKATPGPWKRSDDAVRADGVEVCGYPYHHNCTIAYGSLVHARERSDADLDLIAHAPTDLRDLLAALAAVEAERDAARACAARPRPRAGSS